MENSTAAIKKSLKDLDTATVAEAIAIRAGIALVFGEEAAEYIVTEFLKKLRV